MFASHMGRDDAADTQSREEPSEGDFDQTPAPSARPSMAQIRADEDAVNSDHSSHSKAVSTRSRSVRNLTGGTALVDTASNSSAHHSRRASAVLPDSASERSKADHENQSATSLRRASANPSTRSSASQSASNRGVSPSIPLADRICLDPTLHTRETHAHAHHPGLLRGADFCESGAPTTGQQQLWSSPGHTSSSSDNFSIKSGRIHQILPGGDKCTTRVKVQVPRPIGHSRAVKVRPIPEDYTVYRPVTMTGDSSRLRNKAAPFDPAFEALSSGASQADVEDNASLTDADNVDHGQKTASQAEPDV